MTNPKAEAYAPETFKTPEAHEKYGDLYAEKKVERSRQGEGWNSGEHEQKRRAPRRPVNTAVGLLYKGRYHVACCFEIGEGGMLITSNEPLQKEDRLLLTIRIGENLKGVAIGQVIYTVPPEGDFSEVRYGITFEDISFETKRKIRNFVASGTRYIVS